MNRGKRNEGPEKLKQNDIKIETKTKVTKNRIVKQSRNRKELGDTEIEKT